MIPAVGLVSGEVRMVRHKCKDRACPACAEDRARKNAAQMRRFYELRREQWDAVRGLASWMGHGDRGRPVWVFYTLTRPKLSRRDADAEQAYAEFMQRWRRLTNPKTIAGRKFRALAPGGIRAVEMTWSEGSGYAGWHPHAHCIAELAPGVTLEEFRAHVEAVWCVDGARDIGQDFRLLTEHRIGQLAKYVSKPLQDVAENVPVAQELFAALAGKRLLSGRGTWQSWRVEEEIETEPIALARASTGAIWRAATDRRGVKIEFRSYSGEVRTMTAEDAWSSLERHRGETWGEWWSRRAAMPRVESEAAEALRRVLAFEASSAAAGPAPGCQKNAPPATAGPTGPT